MASLLKFFLIPILVSIGQTQGVEIGIMSQDIMPNKAYSLHIDYSELTGNVTFKVNVRTIGWIGFGLSPNGDMTGADIVIGGIKDNQPYFGDYHGIGKMMPILDKNQDWHLISANENGTHTWMEFTRIVNTCDEQDLPFVLDTQKIIWSFGNTDEIGQHEATSRGAHSVNLLDPFNDQIDLKEFEYMDMKVNHIMPRDELETDTTNWCTFYRAPNFTEERHVVAFDIILGGNVSELYTHHMDVYQCDAPPGKTDFEIFDHWVDREGGHCWYPNAEPDFPVNYCSHFQYGWAVGGLVTILPEHVGIPFYPNKYYMTAVHYDNPESLTGVQVESGMRLYHTEKLRDNDGAFLVTAAHVKYTQIIPPNSEHFTTAVHCSPDCTANFPEEGINVFALLLHAHKTGVSIKIRAFRNGVELPWLIYDSSYDFNFQQNRLLREEVKLYRGDHIVTECTYDTRPRNGETVLGGPSTYDEMCTPSIIYYPRMPDFTECVSEYPEEKMLEFFGLESVEVPKNSKYPIITAPAQFKGLLLSRMVSDNFTWTPALREEFQERQLNGGQSVQCYPFDNSWHHNVSYPKAKEYVPENWCALNKQGSAGIIRISHALIILCIGIWNYM